MEASLTKSKVKHLIDNEGYKKGIQQRHTYITERNRNECSAIFATRTKMLGVKTNYHTAHNDLVCRWCKADQETRLLPTYHCTNKTYGRSTLTLTGITGTTHTLYGRL